MSQPLVVIKGSDDHLRFLAQWEQDKYFFPEQLLRYVLSYVQQGLTTLALDSIEADMFMFILNKCSVKESTYNQVAAYNQANHDVDTYISQMVFMSGYYKDLIARHAGADWVNWQLGEIAILGDLIVLELK